MRAGSPNYWERRHDAVAEHGRVLDVPLALLPADIPGPGAQCRLRAAQRAARAAGSVAPGAGRRGAAAPIMTARQRRMTLVAVIIAGVPIAGTPALLAFRADLMVHFVPSKVTA